MMHWCCKAVVRDGWCKSRQQRYATPLALPLAGPLPPRARLFQGPTHSELIAHNILRALRPQAALS